MRLIDADRLKSYIDCGHLRPSTELCFTELDVCNMVDKQPTIDGIPTERTGKWITEKRDPQDVYAHTYCSECDAYWSSPTLVDSFNFCPNCGARMRR